MQVRSLGQENPLEKGMAAYSSILEPGRPQSRGSQRVRHRDLAHMHAHRKVPWKNKNRAAIWSTSPSPRHIFGENSNWKNYMHPNVHFSTIYNIHDMETTCMPINRGLDKENVIHIYKRKLLSHRKRMK